MAYGDFIDALKTKFNRPLPGKKAQLLMAHGARKYLTVPPDDVRKAGVIALFYPKKINGISYLSSGVRLTLMTATRGKSVFLVGKWKTKTNP